MFNYMRTNFITRKCVWFGSEISYVGIGNIEIIIQKDYNTQTNCNVGAICYWIFGFLYKKLLL